VVDQAAMSISRKSRNVIIGKIIVILILGSLAGYFAEMSARADYEKGKSLTREAYLADYDKYRAELTDSEPSPVAFAVLVSLLVMLAAFGLYELAGKVLGAVIGRILDAAEGNPTAVERS